MFLIILFFCIYEKHIFVLQCKDKGAFTVLVDSYVKEEEGTGVVHQAPYFGAVSIIYGSFMSTLFQHTLLGFPATVDCQGDYEIKQSSLLLLTNIRSIISSEFLHTLVTLVC